jgi:hypothetical protein
MHGGRSKPKKEQKKEGRIYWRRIAGYELVSITISLNKGNLRNCLRYIHQIRTGFLLQITNLLIPQKESLSWKREAFH